MTTTIDVRRHAKAKRPRPLVPIVAIQRLLLRHAAGPRPEVRLVIAVICQALVDLRGADEDERRSARVFVEGRNLEVWAALIGLDADFIRDLARQAHYLTELPEKPRREVHR